MLLNFRPIAAVVARRAVPSLNRELVIALRGIKPRKVA